MIKYLKETQDTRTSTETDPLAIYSTPIRIWTDWFYKLVVVNQSNWPESHHYYLIIFNIQWYKNFVSRIQLTFPFQVLELQRWVTKTAEGKISEFKFQDDIVCWKKIVVVVGKQSALSAYKAVFHRWIRFQWTINDVFCCVHLNTSEATFWMLFQLISKCYTRCLCIDVTKWDRL